MCRAATCHLPTSRQWGERFAQLAHSTLRTEMDLHRAYAAEWGISGADLER
jgi:thiaminase/transcriptional activator TenA